MNFDENVHLEKVFIDVVEFENIVKQRLDFKDENALKNALELYKGHYLEEEGWLWAEIKKEELRKKHEVALKILGKKRYL